VRPSKKGERWRNSRDPNPPPPPRSYVTVRWRPNIKGGGGGGKPEEEEAWRRRSKKVLLQLRGTVKREKGNSFFGRRRVGRTSSISPSRPAQKKGSNQGAQEKYLNKRKKVGPAVWRLEGEGKTVFLPKEKKRRAIAEVEEKKSVLKIVQGGRQVGETAFFIGHFRGWRAAEWIGEMGKSSCSKGVIRSSKMLYEGTETAH